AFVSMSMETANDSEMILVGDGHDVRFSRKPKFIIDSEEVESDKSDGELDVNVGQSVGYDTICAICDNGGEILSYVFSIQVHGYKDLHYFALHPLCITKKLAIFTFVLLN
ncbi:hypothetical protein HN51_007901, partial [Arachis hypogaea]